MVGLVFGVLSVFCAFGAFCLAEQMERTRALVEMGVIKIRFAEDISGASYKIAAGVVVAPVLLIGAILFLSLATYSFCQ